MKISFIATVYNEERTIGEFISSIFAQTKMPNEIIIVDGGSSDNTVAKVKSSRFAARRAKLKVQSYNIKFKIIKKQGNRAVGRNEAIRNSIGGVILCSDAGCILDKDWVKNITKPFKDEKIDVVAGYYKGIAKNVFQKCLIPYVLVMSDKVIPSNFLPASRSIAFKKSVWEKTGGFPENLSHNEDFAFAKILKEINVKIVFEKDAIVNWIPRKNIKEAFIMFFRFALGDAESGIIRPKVVLIFSRYLIGVSLIISFFVLKLPLILNSLFIILGFYIGWSIFKNYKYVKNWQAIFFLPLLQLASDIAVLGGTAKGILEFTFVKKV